MVADCRKRRVNKAFDAEPQIASFLKSMSIGGGPVTAVVRGKPPCIAERLVGQAVVFPESSPQLASVGYRKPLSLSSSEETDHVAKTARLFSSSDS